MSEWWPEKKLGAAAAVFDDRGRVLLVKHSYGPLNWELPGGAVESGARASSRRQCGRRRRRRG